MLIFPRISGFSSSLILFHLFFLLLLLLTIQWSTQERTRKASKGTVERIKRLINEKARRDFAQQDAVRLAEPPARNPLASRHHDELAVNGEDGEYLQGDLELAEWQAERLAQRIDAGNGANVEGMEGQQQEGGRGKRRRKRKLGREPFYKRWNRQRPISFDIADNVPEETRQKIRQALALWQSETCLRFAEGGPDVDRLEFFDGAGCSSFVGRAGGTQGISIATPGCDFVGIIAHEIGHALGTFHEQARPDQPRNIAVHYNNIPVSRWNNFQPIDEDQAETLGLPYDAGSVMHYGAYGFAADQFRPTISTLDPNWQTTIGQRTGPSFLDIQAINEAYSCNGHCPPPLHGCQHGGYPHPNNCAHCQCPIGFSGQFCQSVEPSPCGGTLKLSTHQSVISSPNYPTPFPLDLSCFWLLKAPPGGRIFLQFVDQFLYTCEDTCDKTFVEIKPGADFRVTGYRFCCSIAPANTFRSVGAEMLVIHSGTGGPSSSGFRAQIWSDLDWIEDGGKNSEGKGQNWIDSEQESSRIEGNKEGNTGKQAKMGGSIGIEGGMKGGGEEGKAGTATAIAHSTTTASATVESTTSTTTTMATMTTAATLGTIAETGIGIEGSSSIGTSEAFSTSSSFSTPSPPPPSHPSPPLIFPSPSSLLNCTCHEWSDWSECSQMCGGCGRRRRQRECLPVGQPLCQREERRMCNQNACPSGTNFLFNNGEFHLLWKGCCIGLFLRQNNSSTLSPHSSMPAGQSPGECGPLDTNDNAFLRIISSLLTAQDGKRKAVQGSGSDLNITAHELALLAKRRTGEH